MSAFLKAAFCNGQRPEGVLPVRHVPRPELAARMLRSRSVARFIVAPDGFGKTAVAAEYAETVFGFKRIFWVDCRSPCFLRDLDAGVIADAMASIGPTSHLAVFDDLPPLDPARAERFAALADELLAEEVEVVVTCPPSSDAFGALERDRLLLGPADLLLAEEEAALHLAGEGPEALPDELRNPAERVACLRWAEGGQRMLARGIRREELPADLLLALLVTCALGAGSVDDLAAFLPERRCGELARALEEGYPFCGVDTAERRYRAAAIPLAELAQAVSPSLPALAAAAGLDDRDVLATRLADALIARGAHRRAAEAVDALASRQACGTWLADRGWAVTCAGQARAVDRLYGLVSHKSQPRRAALNVAAGWAAAALGDEARAAVLGRRALTAPAAEPDERLGGAALVMRHGEPDDVTRAAALASTLLAHGEEGLSGRAPGVLARVAAPLAAPGGEPGAGPAARAERAAAAWGQAAALTRPGDGDVACALLLAASWVLAAGREAGADPAALAPAAEHAAARLEAAAEAGEPLGWAALAAGSALEPLVAAQEGLARLRPSAALVAALREAAAREREERAAYRRALAAADRRSAAWRRAHPDPFREDRRASRGTEPASRPAPPLLRVDLFGGMSVRLGDEPVTDRLRRHRKAKTLLAVLVLRRGGELPLDRLAEALWPGSDTRTARKNLTSTWSRLSRALAVDGSCPYLSRDDFGCRLDARLVDSDVARFEALCRRLLFGRAQLDGWEDLYSQVSGPYAEDLLPCEHDSALVDALRLRYRTELSDALVAASERLAEAGEVRGALWFAREALRRDRSREDAYVALMRAQVAAGQRAAALETYFSCRAYLAEELGIDPSPGIVELYRGIIEEEVDV